MASYKKTKTGWKCQVRRVGYKGISRTFDTYAQAERWALGVEASMGVGAYQDARETLQTSLYDCLDRYAREITALKKGAKRELVRVNFWKREPLAAKPIGSIRQVDIALWRDNRLSSVSGSSVTKDLALLSHVFTICIKEWGYPLTNPVNMIRKPKPSPGRTRRLQAGELERILEHCNIELSTWIVLAIETAMRRGEMHCLTRKNIKCRIATIPETKNGNSRAVPLTTKAMDALNSLPIRIDGKLWEWDIDYYTRNFHMACLKAGISDLRLHDLRREGCTRLLEKGLSTFEAKAISGHLSTAMLERYVKIYTDDLFKKIG